jgi:general stress protein YciG
MTDNTNPGNFANRPKEEVKNIAKKGGEASHSGGFASMDADKQVRTYQRSYHHRYTINFSTARDRVSGRQGFIR